MQRAGALIRAAAPACRTLVICMRADRFRTYSIDKCARNSRRRAGLGNGKGERRLAAVALPRLLSPQLSAL
jgi:hypothetical protein